MATATLPPSFEVDPIMERSRTRSVVSRIHKPSTSPKYTVNPECGKLQKCSLGFWLESHSAAAERTSMLFQQFKVTSEVAALQFYKKKKGLLSEYRNLEPGWNGYNAEPFSSAFVDWVEEIIGSLETRPKVFPTGRGSIQLEYEKPNGDYLEFEIYANSTINMLKMIGDGEEESTIDSTQLNAQIGEFNAN